MYIYKILQITETVTKNQKLRFKLFSNYSPLPLPDQNGFGKEVIVN